MQTLLRHAKRPQPSALQHSVRQARHRRHKWLPHDAHVPRPREMAGEEQGLRGSVEATAVGRQCPPICPVKLFAMG